MGILRISTVLALLSFMAGCSSGQNADPPPPAKTVFDPLTQQMQRARDVQDTVDAHTDGTKKAVDAEERGDSTP